MKRTIQISFLAAALTHSHVYAACSGCAATATYGSEQVAELEATSMAVGKLSSQVGAAFVSLVSAITLMGELTANAVAGAGFQIQQEVRRNTKAKGRLFEAYNKSESARAQAQFVQEQKAYADETYGENAISDDVCKTYALADAVNQAIKEVRPLKDIIKEARDERTARLAAVYWQNPGLAKLEQVDDVLEKRDSFKELDLSNSTLTEEQTVAAIDWINVITEPDPVPGSSEYFDENGLKPAVEKNDRSRMAAAATVIYENRMKPVQDLLADDVALKAPLIQDPDQDSDLSLLTYMEQRATAGLDNNEITDYGRGSVTTAMRGTVQSVRLNNWMQFISLKRKLQLAKVETIPVMTQLQHARLAMLGSAP